MNTFRIPESNLSNFERRMRTVEKKCAANHFNFTCNKIGEEFDEVETRDGEKVRVKFLVYEVEGVVKNEGWEFVATIDHHEAGNVIRRFNYDLDLPEKYLTCGPACDHCNRVRSRKDTYIVYNLADEEFKQVGRSCLKEYTNGIDAEAIAFINQFINDCEHELGGYDFSGSYHRYLSVEEVLNYAFECYRHFGYAKKYFDDEEFNPDCTCSRVVRYMSSNIRDTDKEEMEKVGFDPRSDYAKDMTQKAIAWIKEQEDPGEYMRSLKILASEEYVEYRNLGILVSLTITYDRAMKKAADKAAKEAIKKAEHDAEMVSEYQGIVGDKLTVNCKQFACITTSYSQFGESYLYKFTDDSGNIYIWWASRSVNDPEKVTQVTGTVKAHSEFRDVKQTVLTRCKVA